MSLQQSRAVFTTSDRLTTSRPEQNHINVLTQKFSNDKPICRYSHLIEYVDRTSSLRKAGDTSQLFVSYCKPRKGVSTTTLARWIKMLMNSGIDLQLS